MNPNNPDKVELEHLNQTNITSSKSDLMVATMNDGNIKASPNNQNQTYGTVTTDNDKSPEIQSMTDKPSFLKNIKSKTVCESCNCLFCWYNSKATEKWGQSAKNWNFCCYSCYGCHNAGSTEQKQFDSLQCTLCNNCFGVNKPFCGCKIDMCAGKTPICVNKCNDDHNGYNQRDDCCYATFCEFLSCVCCGPCILFGDCCCNDDEMCLCTCCERNHCHNCYYPRCCGREPTWKCGDIAQTYPCRCKCTYDNKDMFNIPAWLIPCTICFLQICLCECKDKDTGLCKCTVCGIDFMKKHGYNDCTWCYCLTCKC